jgi:hypothetical protein
VGDDDDVPAAVRLEPLHPLEQPCPDRRRLRLVVEQDREVAEPLDDERVGEGDVDLLADGLDRNRMKDAVQPQDEQRGDRCGAGEDCPDDLELPDLVEPVGDPPAAVEGPLEVLDPRLDDRVGIALVVLDEGRQALPAARLARPVALGDPADDARDPPEQVAHGLRE